MKLLPSSVAAAIAVASFCLADQPLSSHQILPSNFQPPQVFKNADSVRNINLEKGYVKVSVNVAIENIDKKAQDEYFIPFDAETIPNVGGLEVRERDKKDKSAFRTELVEYDASSSTQFYRVTFPQPLAPKAKTTLSISYHILSQLSPLPALISQQDKQYLQFAFSTYNPSAYSTDNQKTKIKLPTVDIPDFTGNPQRQGTTYTYGPYKKIPPGAEEQATVRYEFTKPLIHATLLERDVEISQWGGNAAFEERLWLTNRGAALRDHFSRLQWAQQQYYSPPTSAITKLRVPLRAGAQNPYFTDDIGNVSTSNFRDGRREASLELKPRYPIFGGWKFPFRIGWDASAKDFLRKVEGNTYVLNVPFLEGPKMPEGMSYERIDLRVILPEGATNVKFETAVPLVSNSTSLHRTFMDTLGRTTLSLTALNVVDELRDVPLFVTYDYPFSSAFRKPLTIFVGILAVFATAWAVGNLDVSIGRKK